VTAQSRTTQQGDALLRAKDAAAELNISIRHFWQLVADGELPRIRVGGSTRFHPADLDAFIAARRETGGRSP
jgi:excisionase family DNA binding protein